MRKFFALAAVAVMLAAGCGTAGTSTLPAAPAAVAAQTGAITLNLGSGYATQATVADIAIFEIEIASPVLSGPRLKVLDKTSMPADRRVTFGELPPGAYLVKTTAKDASGKVLGAASGNANVVAGQTAVVAVGMKLVATEVTNAQGAIAIDLTITDGDVVVLPVQTPPPATVSATPTPTPVPTLPPSTGMLGLYNVQHSEQTDGKFLVKGTIYNSDTLLRVGEVKVEYKAMKGLFFRRLETIETRTEIVIVDAKAMRDFGLTSTEKASSASVTLTLK